MVKISTLCIDAASRPQVATLMLEMLFRYSFQFIKSMLIVFKTLSSDALPKTKVWWQEVTIEATFHGKFMVFEIFT